jgi:quinol monooxygenase YgiN
LSSGKYDIKNGILASSMNSDVAVTFALGRHFGLRRMKMLSVGLFVRLEAKPGKEEAVAAFLRQGLEMANQEATTLVWFALRLGPSTFAIFDAFADESGRQTHLNGPIAKALMANAPDLFAVPPSIEPVEILGAKQ